MAKVWGKEDDNTLKGKELLLSWISDYLYSDEIDLSNKFKRYIIKRNVVVALDAFSQNIDLLNEFDKDIIYKAFIKTLSDSEIRNGFVIKDTYVIPDTMYARDSYCGDSRLIYLNAVMKMIEAKIVPEATFECFLNDLNEIADVVLEHHKYINWDGSLSFSHNARGLKVLISGLSLLKGIKKNYLITDIACTFFGENSFRYINPKSVALFMPFQKDYTQSFQYSVQEILSFLGFETWFATKDPYDSLVMDNIFKKLLAAQFVIIDCSTRSANVMYETGLSHGLGKYVLLAGQNVDNFPYEQDSEFDTFVYCSDGNINPPPFRDAQKGIINFILKHLDDFCLLDKEKEEIKQKIKDFCELNGI